MHVEEAARELAWFATHPDRATEPARPEHPLAIGRHALLGGCQRLLVRLRARAGAAVRHQRRARRSAKKRALAATAGWCSGATSRSWSIAPTGHTSKQAAQSMQSSGSM